MGCWTWLKPCSTSHFQWYIKGYSIDSQLSKTVLAILNKNVESLDKNLKLLANSITIIDDAWCVDADKQSQQLIKIIARNEWIWHLQHKETVSHSYREIYDSRHYKETVSHKYRD